MNTQPSLPSRRSLRGSSYRAKPGCDSSRRRGSKGRISRKAAGLVDSWPVARAALALADHIEKHFKVDARPVITLHNPNGTVTVKAWTKSEVMVIATRASDQVEVDAEQTGNRVDIMTHPASDGVPAG